MADGVVVLTLMLPCDRRHAEAASLVIGEMGLSDWWDPLSGDAPAEARKIEMKAESTISIYQS